jgi:hypothetical protein
VVCLRLIKGKVFDGSATYLRLVKMEDLLQPITLGQAEKEPIS